jgi:hypothetical protein
MFFGKKDEKAAETEFKLREANNTITRLENEIKSLRDTDRNCSFVIDWNNLDVFSIERRGGDTIIGYYLEEPIFHEKKEMWVPKKVVKEWYIACSVRIHEKLVTEYLDSKDKTSSTRKTVIPKSDYQNQPYTHSKV